MTRVQPNTEHKIQVAEQYIQYDAIYVKCLQTYKKQLHLVYRYCYTVEKN